MAFPPGFDSRDITPEIALEDMLNRIRDGKEDWNKLLILRLNDEGPTYLAGYIMAGLSNVESLSLLEVTKTMMLQEMGFIPTEEEDDEEDENEPAREMD